MVCIDTSRLKIGRPPDAEGRGQSRAGILIRRFSGPREGVAYAGRQSLGQGVKDISACGEKSSPSPWSSPPWRGNNIRCLAVHRRPSTSGDQGLRAAAGRPIHREHPNAIPSPGGEGQDEGELPAPKAVISHSRGRSPVQIESKLVQVKSFHRRDAETRRNCEVGESTRKRVEVSGGTRRGDSNLRGLASLRDESGIFGANRSESNQVQANDFFSRAPGAGRAPPPGPRGMRDRRGCHLISICGAAALKVRNRLLMIVSKKSVPRPQAQPRRVLH
jgi:hypothetical protein